MASINYPYQNPKNEFERAANGQAADDYQRQEDEAATLLRLADELPPVAPELLLEQVRLDLATTGLHVAPPEPPTDEDQGGVVVYINDEAQVVVDWLPHARLDREALDMAEADRTDGEAVVRYETVRSAMDTALGTILTGFGYAARRPEFGFATPSSRPPQAAPTLQSAPIHEPDQNPQHNVVAYQHPDQSGVLLWPEHGDTWTGSDPARLRR
ncbi:hypothetical protein ACFWPU_35925 [Streptomyces sp. NPDC058471]|uniref:hypothetical protein n=1 Tax=Streptomyces sp. NPDC058471 TaxID=3346516 RepID=UPI00365C722A